MASVSPHQAPKSAIARQLIVSGVAVGIMGIGAWSLLGQSAPYHPEILSDEVSRDGNQVLIGSTD